jgi:hypothetical protein
VTPLKMWALLLALGTLAVLCRLRPELVPLCQVVALLVVVVTYMTSIGGLRP